ncbi:RNA polymerase sigma factor [Flavitalea flava]
MSSNFLNNESDLLLRVAKGDEAAYKQLFQHYWPRVYSVALIFVKAPELAEDAAQDVFAQLWVKRALLGDVKDFRPYLMAAAKNLILNKLRGRILTDPFSEYLQEYFADSLSDPAAKLELKDASQIIEDGINQLTPQQQKVFRLSRFQGLSHAEIAKATGLSQRTIKNYMVSAILSLRNYLDKYADGAIVFLWMLVFL